MKQLTDYFKEFKVFVNPKLTIRKGIVKAEEDQIFRRKVLLIDGTVSTANYIRFTMPVNSENQSYRHVYNQRYLYFQVYRRRSQAASIQLTLNCQSQCIHILLCTSHQGPPKHTPSAINFGLPLKEEKWTVLVVDICGLLAKIMESAAWTLGWSLIEIQMRANMKIKGIFQSQCFYAVGEFPKALDFRQSASQEWFSEFEYLIVPADLPADHITNIEKAKVVKKEKIATAIKENAKQKVEGLENFAEEQENRAVTSSKNSEKDEARKKPSLQLGDEKGDKHQKQSKEKDRLISQEKSELSYKLRPLPKDQNGHKNQKATRSQNQINGDELIPSPATLPLPSSTLTFSLLTVQGSSHSSPNFRTLSSYLTYPLYSPLHKPVKFIQQITPTSLLTVYNDGTLCLWNARPGQFAPQHYIDCGFTDVTACLRACEWGLLVVGWSIVGKATTKRIQALLAVDLRSKELLFRQSLKADIKHIFLLDQDCDSSNFCFWSIGKESIRLWKIFASNGESTPVPLGQLGRKNVYSALSVMKKSRMLKNGQGSLLEGEVVAGDMLGFITTFHFKAQGTVRPQFTNLSTRKVASDPITSLLWLTDSTILLLSTCKGTVVFLNPALEILGSFELALAVIGLFSFHHISNPEAPGETVSKLNFQYTRLQPEEATDILVTTVDATGILSLRSKTFTFTERKNSALVTCISAHPSSPVIVSTSTDGTLRIWHAFKEQSILKQKHQYLIKGTFPTVVVATKSDSTIIVGFEDGYLRKFQSAAPYRLLLESKVFSNPIFHVDISHNDRYILSVCKKQGAALLDQDLQTLLAFENSLYAGFSIQLLSGQAEYFVLSVESGFHQPILRVYSLNRPLSIKYELDLSFWEEDEQVTEAAGLHQIVLASPYIYICYTNYLYQYFLQTLKVAWQQHYPLSIPARWIYSNGLLQPNGLFSRYNSHISICVSNTEAAPVLISYSYQNKIHLSTMDGVASDSFELPQDVVSIKILVKLIDATLIKGEIVCSGSTSFALYLLQFELRSYSSLKLTQIKKNPRKQSSHAFLQQDARENLNSDISSLVSRCVKIEEPSIPIVRCSLEEPTGQPAQDHPQAENYEELYQKCQSAINPFYSPKNAQQKKSYNYPSFRDSYIASETQHPKKLRFGVSLNSALLWHPEQHELVYHTGRTLTIHTFAKPCYQMHVELPLEPGKISHSSLNSNHKYVGALLHNSLYLYSLVEDSKKGPGRRLVQTKCITFLADKLVACEFSRCQTLAVVVGLKKRGSSTKGEKQKSTDGCIEIQLYIVEVLTGSIIAGSYYEPLDISTIQLLKITINPFTPQLEFLLMISSEILFYRLSSALSLQIQHLYLPNQVKSDCSLCTSASFLDLSSIKSHQYTYYSQIISFGTANGSLLLVDSRSGTLIAGCIGIVNNSILASYFWKGSLLILSGLSGLCFRGIESLEGLLEFLQSNGQGNSKGVESKHLTLDGKILQYSLMNVDGQILVLTEPGTLWMLDIEDLLTIKIWSFSSSPPTAALFSPCTKSFYSAAPDGYIRQTHLTTFDPLSEIYRPRKSAQQLFFDHVLFPELQDVLVVVYTNEIMFYHQNRSLALVTTDYPIVCAKQPPGTKSHSKDLYQNQREQGQSMLVLTSQNTLILERMNDSLPIKLEFIVVSSQTLPITIEINPFVEPLMNFLVYSEAKINLYTRYMSPVGHLSNSCESRWKYYPIDTYSPGTQQGREIGSHRILFLNAHTYLCLMSVPNKIVFRNFALHTVEREIILTENLTGIAWPSSSTQSLPPANFSADTLLGFDQGGNLLLLDILHGIVLNSFRIYHGPIKEFQVIEGGILLCTDAIIFIPFP